MKRPITFFEEKVHLGDLAGGFSVLEMTWVFYCAGAATDMLTYLTVELQIKYVRLMVILMCFYSSKVCCTADLMEFSPASGSDNVTRGDVAVSTAGESASLLDDEVQFIACINAIHCPAEFCMFCFSVRFLESP